MALATEVRTLKRHPKCSSLFSTRERMQSSSCEQPLPPLSPSIAYLEQLTMYVNVSKALKGGPQYAMTVHHGKSKATWRHCRDFEEYKAFQNRLVAAMQRGHLCFAECPWLFTFVKQSFPKPSFFNYASPRVVELRRRALGSFFNTLQAVLLNRANHCCDVLTDAVAREFVGFVYGDASSSAPWELTSPVAARGGISARTFSETFLAPSSTSSLTSDEESDERDADCAAHCRRLSASVDERECCAMCALHQVRSDEQVFSWWQSKNRYDPAPGSLASTSSSSSSSCECIGDNDTHRQHRFQSVRSTSSIHANSKAAPRARPASLQLTLVSEPMESPLFSLSETAVLGDDDVAVLERHDGTPKEAYPGTPKCSFRSSNYPTGWATSSLSSPPPQTLSFLRDSDDELASAKKKKEKEAAASAQHTKRGRSPFNSVPTPTLLQKRICTLPRRSLHALSSMGTALSMRLSKPPQSTGTAGRYHLYITYSCPFACRALAARNLKGLEDVISLSVAHPVFQKTKPDDASDDHKGWTFVDPATDKTFSADILRTLNTGFRELVPSTVDLLPEGLVSQVEEANDGIVAEIGAGVFRARTKPAEEYEAEITTVFASVARLDELLSKSRYLVGSGITEADVRLFHTLIRFDVIQRTSSAQNLTQYPNVVNYLRDLYQTPALKATVNWAHLKISGVNHQPPHAPLPEADAEFPAEAGRYHLYITYSCPYACRALAARNLKGLEDVISLSVAHPIYQKTKPDDASDDHKGWTF
ncbi:hypothetical protein PybrP1_011968, partial [[Pythium] brassicae (nom. inval.)]